MLKKKKIHVLAARRCGQGTSVGEVVSFPWQKASWTESDTGVEHHSVAGELVVTLPEMVEEREMDGLLSF